MEDSTLPRHESFHGSFHRFHVRVQASTLPWKLPPLPSMSLPWKLARLPRKLPSLPWKQVQVLQVSLKSPPSRTAVTHSTHLIMRLPVIEQLHGRQGIPNCSIFTIFTILATYRVFTTRTTDYSLIVPCNTMKYIV